MLILLFQAAGSVLRTDSLGNGGGLGEAFAFWSGTASIAGLVLTVVGLALTIWSLRKALEAQSGAERARESAEEIRSQYARKQRLPEFRDQLNELATQLDTALNDFQALEAQASETTIRITRTVQSVAVHLQGDHLIEVTALAEQIQRHAGLVNLQNGHKIKNHTREVVLYLTHVIDDERAKSL